MVRDLDTLRVIADALRAQIIEALILEPLTVKQIAEKLGLAPGKLYYHVNLLEKHGLVRVVETRVVSGIIEKRYRAAASSVEIDDRLLSFAGERAQDDLGGLVAVALDATREDIQRSLQARALALEQGAPEQPRRVVITREVSRLSEPNADAFRDRLLALIHEFAAAEETGGEGAAGPPQTYALTVAFYPSFYFREGDGAGDAPGDGSAGL